LTRLVLDSSAVLAVIKQEAGAATVAPLLLQSALAAPNAAEIGDQMLKRGASAQSVAQALIDLNVTVVAADLHLAIAASEMFLATRRVGLSLGDRFCLALAKRLELPALTGDRRWLEIANDVGVTVELFR
jgi:ribonuclease VapC